MYVSIAEAAEYLEISEQEVRQLIFERKIRAVHDGEQYLVNTTQFETHFKQMENYRELVEEILSEPIPESPDVKDED